MTTLPAVAPAEVRPAESPATPVVAPAVAAPEAVPQAGFADTLLALSVLPSLSATPALPPSPLLAQEAPPSTEPEPAKVDGDESSGLQELATPTPLPMPLPLGLPFVPAALSPSLFASAASFQGLAGAASGAVPANARETPALPSAAASLPSTTLSLLTDTPPTQASGSVGGLPLGPAAPDGGSLPLVASTTGSSLPLWLGHAQPGEPRVALPEWAPLTLPVGQPARWGESLRTALGERMAVQSAHGMDRALIRLDPPSFGSLEIAIRHEAGALTVQLVASHGEVVRQLQAIGDALRQDLSARQYTQVTVEVHEGAPGSGQGQGQGRSGRESQQNERAPGRALAEAGGEGSGPFALG